MPIRRLLIVTVLASSVIGGWKSAQSRSDSNPATDGLVDIELATRPQNSFVATDESPQTMQLAQAQSSASEPGWGHLRGRLVFDGPAPEPQKLELNKDIEFCSKHPPVDESLVVNAENQGLANAVLWLQTGRSSKIPVHASYQNAAEENVTLKNEHCRFDPHVCVVRTSQTLVIGNADAVGHNTAANLLRNFPFNAVTGPDANVEQKFGMPERKPAKVQCSIHPWMTAWLVVTDHPYVAVTDENGGFEIRNLPAGEHTFQIWHESAEVFDKVTRDGKPVELDRGQLTATIDSGVTDLGELRVSPAIFE